MDDQGEHTRHEIGTSALALMDKMTPEAVAAIEATAPSIRKAAEIAVAAGLERNVILGILVQVVIETVCQTS